MMNSKEKAKRGERRSRAAVEFVVPLQLEQCLYYINYQPRGMPLKVTVAPAKDGTLQLTALLRHNGVVTVRCEGELRRWEGTSTQVGGQREVLFRTLPNNSIWGCGVLGGILVIVLTILALMSVLVSQIPPPLAVPSVCIRAIPAYGIPIGIGWLSGELFLRLLIRYRCRLHERELVVRLKRILNGTEKY
ncbi:MAG TPA: hypothetical protein VHO69_07205 [Phototrophicaceae bacterium]|nr:hypothetical protein [Phototrophicaceae bacterium]